MHAQLEHSLEPWSPGAILGEINTTFPAFYSVIAIAPKLLWCFAHVVLMFGSLSAHHLHMCRIWQCRRKYYSRYHTCWAVSPKMGTMTSWQRTVRLCGLMVGARVRQNTARWRCGIALFLIQRFSEETSAEDTTGCLSARFQLLLLCFWLPNKLELNSCRREGMRYST